MHRLANGEKSHEKQAKSHEVTLPSQIIYRPAQTVFWSRVDMCLLFRRFGYLYFAASAKTRSAQRTCRRRKPLADIFSVTRPAHYEATLCLASLLVCRFWSLASNQ